MTMFVKYLESCARLQYGQILLCCGSTYNIASFDRNVETLTILDRDENGDGGWMHASRYFAFCFAYSLSLPLLFPLNSSRLFSSTFQFLILIFGSFTILKVQKHFEMFQKHNFRRTKRASIYLDKLLWKPKSFGRFPDNPAFSPTLNF